MLVYRLDAAHEAVRHRPIAGRWRVAGRRLPISRRLRFLRGQDALLFRAPARIGPQYRPLVGRRTGPSWAAGR
ncbi:hypothetical protein GCM10007886_46440 [Methylobacterium gregans]|nr:hypothetical protein GCM10007886_46440 [Methylobacterium gregans]